MHRIFRRPARTTLIVVALSALVGVAAGIAAGASIWSGSSTPIAIAPAAATTSFLWSIPAADGTLLGPNDDHLTLHLDGTRTYMTRFTDRPLREAFVVANQDFARRFAHYFGSSSPNAVLTYTPPGSRLPVSIVLTISNARWNPATPGWTFTATRIRKKTDNLPDTTIHVVPPVIPNPAAFGHATLLIDDGGLYSFDCVGTLKNETWPDENGTWDVTLSQTSYTNGSSDTWNGAPAPVDPPNLVPETGWEDDGNTQGCSSDVKYSMRTSAGTTYPLEVSVTDNGLNGGGGAVNCTITGLPSSSPLQCVTYQAAYGIGVFGGFTICSTDSRYAYLKTLTCAWAQQHP